MIITPIDEIDTWLSDEDFERILQVIDEKLSEDFVSFSELEEFNRIVSISTGMIRSPSILLN